MTPEINLKKLEAARLYHFTEMDKHEISELLDIPPGAVQSAAVAFKFDYFFNKEIDGRLPIDWENQTREQPPKEAKKIPNYWKYKKIKCIETGDYFYSLQEAAKVMKLNKSSISKVLNGVMSKTGGFTFEYVD
jgi:hypothetical protein